MGFHEQEDDVNVEVVMNHAMLAQVLAERLDRAKIPAATLIRWKGAALIPAEQREFNARDIDKILFIARYLERDRNLDRAEKALIRYLEQQ
jgi:hypothetical protein